MTRAIGDRDRRQNQMTRQAERRAHLDLQINLLAEQESTATLRIVRRIAEHLDIERDRSPADASLAEETDIERLVSKMDEVLPDAPGASSAEPPRPGGLAPSWPARAGGKSRPDATGRRRVVSAPGRRFRPARRRSSS